MENTLTARWTSEFRKSIKSFDTEEKLDLYFYRPAGFLIAKAAFQLGLTPTIVTLLGMLMGVYGGFLYQYNQSTEMLAVGSFLFVLSGIFDSADGQLARISGVSSKFGLILDGICDNLVFSSVYICAAWTLVPQYGILPVYVFAVLCGACHSAQSAALDFYNREYLFFGYGKTHNDDYWNQNVDEAKNQITSAKNFGESIFRRLHFSWIKQQHTISTRTAEQRTALRNLILAGGPSSTRAQELYRDHNRNILRVWRLMGPNFHTIMIITFVFLRRFDLYLLCIDLLGLNIALLIIRKYQTAIDQKFFSALNLQR